MGREGSSIKKLAYSIAEFGVRNEELTRKRMNKLLGYLRLEGRNEKDGEKGRERTIYDRTCWSILRWWGKNAEMSLSYSKDRHKGTLTINSRMISEERRAYEKQRGKERRLKERGF